MSATGDVTRLEASAVGFFGCTELSQDRASRAGLCRRRPKHPSSIGLSQGPSVLCGPLARAIGIGKLVMSHDTTLCSA